MADELNDAAHSEIDIELQSVSLRVSDRLNGGMKHSCMQIW